MDLETNTSPQQNPSSETNSYLTPPSQFLNEYYSGRLQGIEGQPPEIDALCPFHDDHNPSLSVNLETGMYCCHGCGASGDVYQFEAQSAGISLLEARVRIQNQLAGGEQTPVPAERVARTHELLLQSPAAQQQLLARGIQQESWKRFQLGWEGQRIEIPISDQSGRVINIRRHRPGPGAGAKILHLGKGYGRPAQLFPWSALSSDWILLVEGELDAVRSQQEGLPAITTTGGAKCWNDAWNSLFKHKDVVICYDNDEEGQRGARRIADSLYEHASRIRTISLPLSADHADITDYFQAGYTKQDFLELVEQTPSWNPNQSELQDEEELPQITLGQASQSEYDGRRVCFTALVAGKDLEPYLIPRRIMVSCNQDGNQCANCSLQSQQGVLEKTLELDARLLQLIDVPDRTLRSNLLRWCGVVAECPSKTLEILSKVNIERVFLIPELGTKLEQPYTLRTLYFLGHGLITNHSYQLHTLCLADPKTQSATGLIYQAIPHQDDLSSFQMTPELQAQLRIFQSNDDSGEAVQDKFLHIANSLAEHVTFIKERADLHLAVDLVFHSLSSFDFAGRRYHRGWTEALILGDTRTGKSEAVYALQSHYQSGEVISGENTSVAGLLGGLEQSRGNWVLTWGKIPLNDRRMVVIDEMNGLPIETIGTLSSLRSSGIAEIQKIHAQKTHARTRLLWVGNPRANRALDSYVWGVAAIPDLFGRPEDISRLDFALTTAKDEVSLAAINQPVCEEGECPYTSELCQALITWAWSRTPEQIRFEQETEDLLMAEAGRLGRLFTAQVPLVTAADERVKLARLAAACAARLFSTDETGELVVVKPAHAAFIVSFLEQVYSKPSMAYHELSQLVNYDSRIVAQHEAEILEFFDKYPDLLDILMRTDRLNSFDIQDMLGITRQEASVLLAQMTRWRLLDKNRWGYVRTAPFSQLVRKHRRAKLPGV